MRNKLKQFVKPARKRWFTFVNFIPKRVRIVFGVLCMTALMLVSTFFPFITYWYVFTILIIIVAYFVTYFGVFEGIDGMEWVMLFIMPVLLSLGLYFAFSLIPVRWLTRLPFLFTFSLLFYAVLLTSNIFNIGVEKSLQLYRAAFTVNYLLQSILVFAITMVLTSLGLGYALNSLLIFGVATLLATQLIWTVKLNISFDRSLIKFGFLLGLFATELFIAVSFIPLQENIVALLVSASYYSIGGILYHHFDQRLFRNVVREYVFVLCFVAFIAFLTIQW